VERKDERTRRETGRARARRASPGKVSRYWLAGVVLGIVLIAGLVMSLLFVERWVRAQGAQPQFPGPAVTQPERGRKLPEVIIERSQTEEKEEQGETGKRRENK